jgi:hypothetical protein
MFAEWGCQNTSNHKSIQNRKRKRTPIKDEPEENEVESHPPNKPPPLNEVSPKPPAFIDVCPYPSCTSGPFAEMQDYLDHKAAHQALIFNALAWEGPTRPSACDLKEYLRLRVPYTRTEVESIHPGLYRRVFRRDSSSITQLDVVECLEVLLDTGRGLSRSSDHLADVNACSIKAIVSGEVDFTGAERSLKLLLEAIRFFFEAFDEGLESGYPSVIEWLSPLELACKDWDYVKDNLYTLQDDSLVLSPFDRYIPTFIIQNYIRWLQTESIAVPASFDVEIVAICEDLDISLDVKYLLIVQKLPREPKSQPPSLESSASDILNHAEPSQVAEAIDHYNYPYPPPPRPTTSPSSSTDGEASSTPHHDFIDPESDPAAGSAKNGGIQEETPFEKSRCPRPECGKLFRDLKTHLLTHQDDRPHKCPVPTCDYHIKGFARRYDRNRHAMTHYAGTMVCNFCLSGTAPRASFNRVDIFKRHLMLAHAVVPSSASSDSCNTKPSHKPAAVFLDDDSGKCSTCSARFESPRDFYDHLDACILRIVGLDSPEALTADSSAWPKAHSRSGVDNQEDSADARSEVEEIAHPDNSLQNGRRYDLDLSPPCTCVAPVPISYEVGHYVGVCECEYHSTMSREKRPKICPCETPVIRSYDERLHHPCLICGGVTFVCKGYLKDGVEWGCGQRFMFHGALRVHHTSGPGKLCIKPFLDEEEPGEGLDQTDGLAPRSDMQQEQLYSGVILPSLREYWATHPELEHAEPDNQTGTERGTTEGAPKQPAIFQCHLCPKWFTRSYNLRSHLRTHGDERPYICTVCGKAFTSQVDQKRHEDLHFRRKEICVQRRLERWQSKGLCTSICP